MPIFHEFAIRAASEGRADWILSEHFAGWRYVAEVFSHLSLEQRCDVICLDWLLQPHSQAHPALIQIVKLLIGQSALAANDLSELSKMRIRN